MWNSYGVTEPPFMLLISDMGLRALHIDCIFSICVVERYSIFSNFCSNCLIWCWKMTWFGAAAQFGYRIYVSGSIGGGTEKKVEEEWIWYWRRRRCFDGPCAVLMTLLSWRGCRGNGEVVGRSRVTVRLLQKGSFGILFEV